MNEFHGKYMNEAAITMGMDAATDAERAELLTEIADAVTELRADPHDDDAMSMMRAAVFLLSI